MSAAIPIITQTNLISDGPTFPAAQTVANLKDAWGLAIAPNGTVFIADRAAGTATVTDQAGNVSAAAVTIPPPAGGTAGVPTGTVAHTGKGFAISLNGKTAPSTFLVVSTQGTIAGYNPAVDPTTAVLAVDHSSTSDKFTGVASIGSGKGAKLFAADFHNAQIEVFDSTFKQLTLKSAAFTDAALPAGYAPFGVQAIKGKIYVSYALQDAAKRFDVPGVGNGYVDVYNKNGALLRRAASAGTLNSPWGMTVVPGGFGKYSGDLLVGNFGDGKLNLIDNHGNLVTQVTDATGATISIPDLWSLETGVQHFKKTLFFTAGPGLGAHGIYGTLTATIAHKF